MVAVFLAFLVTDEIFLKLLGVGMATAIFLDATVVRMVLVPALMQLFGRANWWIPRWLDRRLPRFDVERAAPRRRRHENTRRDEGAKTMTAVAGRLPPTHSTDDWGHPWWPCGSSSGALIGTAVWLIVRRRERRGDPLGRAREVLAEALRTGRVQRRGRSGSGSTTYAQLPRSEARRMSPCDRGARAQQALRRAPSDFRTEPGARSRLVARGPPCPPEELWGELGVASDPSPALPRGGVVPCAQRSKPRGRPPGAR